MRGLVAAALRTCWSSSSVSAASSVAEVRGLAAAAARTCQSLSLLRRVSTFGDVVSVLAAAARTPGFLSTAIVSAAARAGDAHRTRSASSFRNKRRSAGGVAGCPAAKTRRSMSALAAATRNASPQRPRGINRVDASPRVSSDAGLPQHFDERARRTAAIAVVVRCAPRRPIAPNVAEGAQLLPRVSLRGLGQELGWLGDAHRHLL